MESRAGRERRVAQLQNMEKIRVEEQARFREECNRGIDKAYAHADCGDLYRAYLCFEDSLKLDAAACGTNVCDCPIGAQILVSWHWPRLCKQASDAAEKTVENMARYKESLLLLEIQKKENQRVDDMPIIFV